MRDFTPLDWTRVFEYGANENALGVRSSYSEGKVENGKLVYLLLRVFLKVFFFPFPHYVPPPGIKVCKCTCTLRETKLRAHACHMTRALCARALACHKYTYSTHVGTYGLHTVVKRIARKKVTRTRMCM